MDHPTLPTKLIDRLHQFRKGQGHQVVLTGAGISAESGIPTFRGKEGYWTVGSKEYFPQQLATYGMFVEYPEVVWNWYLYRRGVCRAAKPNAGHEAVVELERLLRYRFRLITQNVDGLHVQAGNSHERTYHIHGNIDSARCADNCHDDIWQLPQQIGLGKQRGSTLTQEECSHLRCPECNGWARPHVLWFDEYYNEEHFRFQSSLEAAKRAEMLIVVGTSGATTLPNLVAETAARRGAFLVDLNTEPNVFSELAEASGGVFLQGASSRLLPLLVKELRSEFLR